MPKHYRLAGKNTEGNAARYRRDHKLGVFPRQPKKKVKGNHHSYCSADAIEAAKHKQKYRRKQSHEELKLEVTVSTDIASRDAEADFLNDLRQIAEDADNMSKIMMSRKKRKLLIAMKYGQEKKRAKARLLTERKKKIAEAKASA